MPLLLLLVPETQQYRVLTGLQKTDPAAAVKEQEAILSEKPVFHAPWMPLRSVRHSAASSHTLRGLCVCIINTSKAGTVLVAVSDCLHALDR